MRKNTISNNCEKCAYFVKHYGNLDGKYYSVTGCKHCINQKLTMREQNKRLDNIVACEYWEPMEIQVKKRRESIKDTFRHMRKCLDEISQILKEDNN